MLLAIPIVFALAFAITGAGIGAIIGRIFGKWIESFLPDDIKKDVNKVLRLIFPQLLDEDEQQDVKTVLSQIADDFGLFNLEEIEQLPEYEQIEIGAKMSDELIELWGRERFCEVEEQIERYLEERGVEVRDHLIVSSR